MTEEWEHVEHDDAHKDADDDNGSVDDAPARSSLRPKEEKVISRTEYKQKRSIIERRLSSKQRIPFDDLILRGIHGGPDDELHESKPFQKSKRILQLNRRLSHRPQPHEIHDDDEFPNDLKIADTEYYKLYHYRDPITDEDDEDEDTERKEHITPKRDRTVSDPIKPIQNIIKSRNTFTSIENPLDWKFRQRCTKNELLIRGIIPEQYADVVQGSKSLEDAKKEWQQYKRASQIQIKKKLDLKIRPTRKDLQDRGIVPDWDNPNIVKETHQRNKRSLIMRLGQRMDPDEADQRAIIDKEALFSNKDYEEHMKDKKESKKKNTQALSIKLAQRMDPHEADQRAIIDKEALFSNKDYAEHMKEKYESNQKTTESLLVKLQQRMDPNEADQRAIIDKEALFSNKDYAEHMKDKKEMRKKKTDALSVKLAQRMDPDEADQRAIIDKKALFSPEDYEEHMKVKQDAYKRTTETLNMKLQQRMDPDEADQRAIIDKEALFSNKDYFEHKKEKKQAVKKLKLKMKDSLTQRSDKDEIIFRGIVPREYLDDDANVAKEKLKLHKASIKKQMDTAYGARPPPSEMSKVHLKSSESNPIPQPHDVDRIALSTVSAGATPVSPYGAFNGVLPTTPEYHEMDQDDGGYNFPTFLDRLKAEKKQTKKVLKNHIKRRSTVEELQKQGILPMTVQIGAGYDGDASDENTNTNTNTDSDDEEDEEFISFLDRMKNENRENRNSIKLAHQRRPTIEEMESRGILKPGSHGYGGAALSKPKPEPAQVYMSGEYANSLNKSRSPPKKKEEEDDVVEDEGTSPEVDDSSSDDSQDVYPTFLDRMRMEKEKTKRILEHKHRRRPSQQDLEDQGIVAKGYFENMQVALMNKKKRRQSFTTELATFFTQRPDIAEMMTKGLVAAEFIGMDAVEMSEKRQAIKAKLNKKLSKKRRPTMDDLEMRGIVPSGYFNDAQKAVKTKHTRRLTAEKDLASFLPQRMNPQMALNKGLIPREDYNNMMGFMNKQQQAFSGGAMGVAGVFSQKLVKQTLNEREEDDDDDEDEDDDIDIVAQQKRRGSKRLWSGIGNMEGNILDHDHWTRDLYESLLNSLRFGEILQRIENCRNSQNSTSMASINDKYASFQRLYHNKLSGLQGDKARILSEIEECDVREKESMDILRDLIIEHSTLEQKIRPQMKMLLHKMSLVETRIANTENALMRDEWKKELNYYETYCTELKNVFIMTNNIRCKYQNQIRTVIEERNILNVALDKIEQDIAKGKEELNEKFEEFHQWISDVTNTKTNANDDNKNMQIELRNRVSETKYDPLASDPITDLRAILDEKSKSIDNNLDLLSFRISTIPATDYALRVIELCQLSYIYSSDILKSFFEWFIRFAVQSFIEITYAHTCFTTQNRKAITEQINRLKSIQFIMNNNSNALFDSLTLIVSYLQLLPSNENDAMSVNNNNIDHEFVIFHVARYLTAHPTFSQTLLSQKEEGDIPHIAQQQVNQWIAVILESKKSQFEFSKDYNKITNLQNRPRNIIKSTKRDSNARVSPSKAAAIVMDHVYGIHVYG